MKCSLKRNGIPEIFELDLAFQIYNNLFTGKNIIQL